MMYRFPAWVIGNGPMGSILHLMNGCQGGEMGFTRPAGRPRWTFLNWQKWQLRVSRQAVFVAPGHQNRCRILSIVFVWTPCPLEGSTWHALATWPLKNLGTQRSHECPLFLLFHRYRTCFLSRKTSWVCGDLPCSLSIAVLKVRSACCASDNSSRSILVGEKQDNFGGARIPTLGWTSTPKLH
jgi:hypothetical protein